MGKLTTHVLDTYHGLPAKTMQIHLFHIAEDETRTLVKTLHTNDDGRIDVPVLQGEEMLVGDYELTFVVRAYFATKGVESPFLNSVPVRFTVYDADKHYHVPLLVSPWAYSTYRGS